MLPFYYYIIFTLFFNCFAIVALLVWAVGEKIINFAMRVKCSMTKRFIDGKLNFIAFPSESIMYLEYCIVCRSRYLKMFSLIISIWYKGDIS